MAVRRVVCLEPLYNKITYRELIARAKSKATVGNPT